MTTTQTIDIQEVRRQRVKQALESANLKATNFTTRQEEIEKVYRKFFDEISKKSEHFILEEKDRIEYFSASMFYIGDDGVTNYSRPTQIDNIPVNYKEFTIKLKADVCKAPVHIIIDEDIKYGRRGKYKNEGWKIQARIRYNDSPKYKTGGSIVKLVNQQVEQEENQRKHDEMVNARRKKVRDALSETFRFCSYEAISDGKEYSVEIKHGVKLIVTTTIDNSDGSVSITPKSTVFTGKSLGNVLRGLESM